MEVFSPLDTLSFESDNLSANWKKWKQDLNFYLTTTEKGSKEGKVKSSIFLHCIGHKGREIYNTFIFEPKEHSMIFTKITEKFDEYCIQRKSITFLRHKCFTHRQVEGQSFHEFVTSLRKLSADCQFGNLNSSLIRDIIVVGVTSNRIRERVPNLSLEQAIRLGQSAEETQKHVKALKQDVEILKINRTHISRSYSPNQNSHSASNPKSNPPNNSSALVIWKCKFCSGTHNKGNCPGYYRNCLKCNRKGHYSSCCNNISRVHQVKEYVESSISDSDSESFVGAINNENTNNTLVAVKKMHSIGVNNVCSNNVATKR